jgi:hypothetical protein
MATAELIVKRLNFMRSQIHLVHPAGHAFRAAVVAGIGDPGPDRARLRIQAGQLTDASYK